MLSHSLYPQKDHNRMLPRGASRGGEIEQESRLRTGGISGAPEYPLAGRSAAVRVRKERCAQARRIIRASTLWSKMSAFTSSGHVEYVIAASSSEEGTPFCGIRECCMQIFLRHNRWPMCYEAPVWSQRIARIGEWFSVPRNWL